MAEISKVLQIGDTKRPESLLKNLYKIDSPYDLTSDIVTKSLNLLQSITGYDYRANPVIDIIERLIDSQNSDLVKIGGERLLVEFGRRAALNVFDKFIPSPTNFIDDLKSIIKGDFRKNDASITDLNKDPSRTLVDIALQKGIGYRSNENYLTKIYKTTSNKRLFENVTTSDVNYFYSGDMVKEKILQLNKGSVFSTLNVKNTSKIEYDEQSLVFRNTYSEIYINQDPEKDEGLYSYAPYTETFTKSYFKNYPRQEGTLIKNYELEKKNIEKEQGFGSLGKMDGFRTDRTTLTIPKELSVENIDTYVYDTDETKQNDINTKFGVRRGLVYFTSKLVKENPTISHNQKLIRIDNDVNPPIAYYKGNGECRTFTIYDQYDNYDRVIKFNGNNEKNSVLRDKVLPRIAPTVDDVPGDKYNYFFTMENLALKDSVDDCEKGPNGGRWMWFPPYDVKISDNNSVNWSDMNFLGRPEPIYSYQNTTRNLSLSFRLLIDTVKEIQDIEPTIQNYYNYLYQCGQLAFKDKVEKKTTEVTTTAETPTKNSQTIPKNILTNTAKYYFKNDGFVIDVANPDYTSADTSFSSFTNNSSFLNEFNQSVNSLKEIMSDKNVTEISMQFEGVATRLITQTLSVQKAKEYNRALGMRRADNLMRNIIYQYNQIRGDAPEIVLNKFSPVLSDSTNVGGQIVNSVYIKEGTVTVNQKTPYSQVIDNKKITIILATTGADSDPQPVDKDPFQTKVNDNARISQRYAIITSMDAKINTVIDDKKIETIKTPIVENVPIDADEASQKTEPCDTNKNLEFESIEVYNKFPTGFEKLNVFTPSFNSQTPFDFTKRYIFLHQLTRPSKLNNLTNIDNTVFGRMPVFVIRYGDFIYSKAIAKSINFDITESTWDLNPEGMGVIPLYCNVTMDLTLIGGQSLAGPIDRIQTANDSNFIANSTFNTGYYANNKIFEKARKQEEVQWPKLASGSKPNPRKRPTNGNRPQDDSLQGVPRVENRPVQTPIKEPTLDSYQFQREQLQDIPEAIDRDKALRDFLNEQNPLFEKGL